MSVLTRPERSTVSHLLAQIQKPARYLGTEFHAVFKDPEDVDLRAVLLFPDLYEIGMSHLGLEILYHILNREDSIWAERAYTPALDLEELLRRQGLPLTSLESGTPLKDFHLVGISLQYELSYTNVLTMLELGGITWLAAARAPQEPVVIAGGPICGNPEPVAPFFDAILVGDGEEAIVEIAAVVRQWRQDRGSRPELWRALEAVEGVYVPAFFQPVYDAAGRLQEMRALGRRQQIRRRLIPDLDQAYRPPRPLVPQVQIVHDRLNVEIARGCTRGCRFCQAGMIYRPVRERPLAEVLAAVDEIVAATGFEEISFLSLSSSDYHAIGELVRQVVARYGSEKLSIGLPSLRIETFSVELMEQLEKGRRRSGFTFAPEAATDRLRDVINKPIATELLLETARQVYRRGWTTIKLYFMIGHPTQTLADVQAIADLTHQVRRIGRQELGGKANVRVGVSTLVPKAHTPFQWAPLADDATIRSQIALLERQLRGPGIEFSYNNPDETLIEAALSRGDRRLADVIETAWRLGARFDGWGDQFNLAAWRQAFAAHGLDPDWYARRERPLDEILPWDFVSVGVKRSFLEAEYRHALAGGVIDDCREHCYSCGILGQFKEARRSAPDDAWGCPPLGSGKKRQPVSPRPVPLYFNEEMSPELAARAGPRVPQRAGRQRAPKSDTD